MKYTNPWSDDERFIYLGEFEYKGRSIDLYVLKHDATSDRPMYFSMGARRSSEPHDYYGISLHEEDVVWFEMHHHYAYVPEIVKRLKDKRLDERMGF